MRRLRIFSALLAVLATCTSAAPPAGAQAAGPAVREKTVAPPVPKTATTPQAGRDTAQQKSVSHKLFDAGWVIFPARVALVTVSMTIAVLLLMGGMWSTARVVHSLWHTKWSEPPRKLKRGEVGAAGTTLAVEWEERLSTNAANDQHQDQQISVLDEAVERLTAEFSAFDARLAILEALTGVHPHERAEDGG